MRVRLAALLLMLGLGAAAAQLPQRLSGPEVSPAVWGVLETPRTPGPQLRDAVLAHHGAVEMYTYPGAQHAFTTPGSPAYLEPAAIDSWKRTIEFLRRRLAK